MNCGLLIADSSDPRNSDLAKRALDSPSRTLNIEYKLYPADIEYAEKVSDSLESINTPYTVLGADDDFFVPSALSRAVRFLEVNPDYSVVHGEAVLFTVGSGKVYGEIERVWRYNQRTIDHSSAVERLIDHLTRYSTMSYSVHHTEQLRGNYQKTVDFGSDPYFSELLPSGLSLIHGKAMKLDVLYMARQAHSAKEYRAPDPMDWITDLGWAGQYGRCRDCLADALVQQDGIGMEAGRGVVKEAFWSYLAQAMMLKWRGAYGQTGRGLRGKLRALIRDRPVIRAVWRYARALAAGRSQEMSLASLLSDSSPYHHDFMPIYRAVTRES